MSEHDLDLEDRLRQELKRVEAPQGFADRVEDLVAEERQRRLILMPRRKAWLAIAAMAVIGIVLGGWQWRQQQLRRERQEAQVARRQFEIAMQVTGRTLVGVQERIGRAGEIHPEGRKREVE